MTSKTIALSGAELRAAYSGGCNAWLRNDGTGTIYASTAPNISAGADGVVSIPAGQAAAIYGACGAVYLLGTGSVMLVGSDYAACPFKTSTSSGGSSGVDEQARAEIQQHEENTTIHVTADEKDFWNSGNARTVDGRPVSDNGKEGIPFVDGDYGVMEVGRYLDFHATEGNDYDGRMMISDGMFWLFDTDGSRATVVADLKGNAETVGTHPAADFVLKTDIPASLPANGGNADTVDGKHAREFLQYMGYLDRGSLLDYVLTMKASGILYVSGDVTDIPVAGQFFFVDVRRFENGSYVITATRFNAGGVYTNRYNSNPDREKWYGWANAADGGNAASVGAYTEAKLAALEARVAALETK